MVLSIIETICTVISAVVAVIHPPKVMHITCMKRIIKRIYYSK